MAGLVLDSWAILAWLRGQPPAAARVWTWLESSSRGELAMSIVNLGEVYYLCAKSKGFPYAEKVISNLRTRLAIDPASDAVVMQAAGLKGRYAISYADAFAAAAAINRGVPLATGDPELRAMAGAESKLKVEWLATGGS